MLISGEEVCVRVVFFATPTYRRKRMLSKPKTRRKDVPETKKAAVIA
jgi:hypothetical protein